MDSINVLNFRNCMVKGMKSQDFGDLPKLCGVTDLSDLIPSVEVMEQLLKYTPEYDSVNVQAITFGAFVKNIAKALGCSPADASQLASECVQESIPLIKQLNKDRGRGNNG